MISLRATNNTTKKLPGKLQVRTKVLSRCKLRCNNNRLITNRLRTNRTKEVLINLRLWTSSSNNQASTWVRFNNRTSRTNRTRWFNNKCSSNRTKHLSVVVIQHLDKLKPVLRWILNSNSRSLNQPSMVWLLRSMLFTNIKKRLSNKWVVVKLD